MKIIADRSTKKGTKVLFQYYSERQFGDNMYVSCVNGVTILNIQYNGSLNDKDILKFLDDVVDLLERAGH